MQTPGSGESRTWLSKFRDAGRGVILAVQGERSYAVHLTAAAGVLATATALGCPFHEWCILFMCIGFVLTAETFNSAMERLAKAVDRGVNPHVGAALDMSSGAVLIASCVAALIGTAIFLRHLGPLAD
jgi:diacylglycerol kinase